MNADDQSNEYPLVSTQENERFEKDLHVQEEVKAAYQKEGASRTTEENIEKHKKCSFEWHKSKIVEFEKKESLEFNRV